MASTAQSRIKSISYAKYGYMFIAPFFIVYLFFQIWPLINTFILSFKGNGNAASDFVAMENYQTLLFGIGDRRAASLHNTFTQSFINTVILWVGNF
ncbi:MAG: sugar ABC transporter permease, partial [Oscillospiraceae bacterium]|nr:sugar ABC transporter permease [Oscillospiraceae bacterium]